MKTSPPSHKLPTYTNGNGKRGNVSSLHLPMMEGHETVSLRSQSRSEKRMLWAGLVMLIGLFIGIVGFFAWMYFGNIDESVTGSGQVVPEGKLQTVASPENGLVAKVFVQEGDHVVRGQVLAELDPEELQLQQSKLSQQAGLLSQEIQALSAATRGDTMVGGSASAEWARAEKAKMEAQLAASNQGILESQSSLQSVQTQYETQKSVVALIEQQYTQLKSLYEAGGYSQQDLRTHEQKLIDARGRLESLKSDVAARQAQLERIKNQPTEIVQSYQANLMNRVANLELQSSSTLGDVRITEASRKRFQIRSPIDGKINEQAIRGPGDVVNMTTPLFKIVPDNHQLQVIVRVPNRDLSYIHLGQQAKIRLDAIPFYQFGGLNGKVEAISPSSKADEKGQIFYEVTIRPERQFVEKNGDRRWLRSGMTATADIITRQKNILSFFTEPIHLTMDRALINPTNR